MTAFLDVADVVRTFGAVRAVDGASFAVDERSITGLIGPNGAGKSTLFATIAGSLKPDSGRIVFAGSRIDRRPANSLVDRERQPAEVGRFAWSRRGRRDVDRKPRVAQIATLGTSDCGPTDSP